MTSEEEQEALAESQAGKGQINFEVLESIKELLTIVASTFDLALAEVRLAWRSVPAMFAWFFFFSGFVLLGWMGLSIIASYAVFLLSDSNLLALLTFFMLQVCAAAVSWNASKKLLARMYLPHTLHQIKLIKRLLYESTKIHSGKS